MNEISQIPQLMQRLVNVMNEKGMSAPKYLSPGITRREILDLTKGVLELPEDVIALYESTNGTMVPEGVQVRMCDVGILYLYTILSLQEALDVREYFLERLKDDDSLLLWIQDTGVSVDGWLPILGENGNYNFIDIDRFSRSEPCIFATGEASDPELVYVSLQSMLRTIISCYEQNAYVIENGELIDSNMEQLKLITWRYNPGLDFAKANLVAASEAGWSKRYDTYFKDAPPSRSVPPEA